MASFTCLLYPQQATCALPRELAELAATRFSMPDTDDGTCMVDFDHTLCRILVSGPRGHGA
eukprot:1414461-Amphidinium_carterae.1